MTTPVLPQFYCCAPTKSVVETEPTTDDRLVLSDDLIRDGFVAIRGAFPTEVAQECRQQLWEQIPEDPDDPSSWTRPVARLGYQTGTAFEASVNTDRLRTAFDTLVGRGRWMPRTEVGTFAIRFPSDQPSGDDGWHIDASFPPQDASRQGDAFAWRVNVASRGRALLMLMLFSDVADEDAPTRLRRGSHIDVARLLSPHRDHGLSVLELSRAAAEATAEHSVDLATGQAGDVYLCHPFLVHAAQGQAAGHPRFLAQPPLHPVGWINGSLDVEAGAAPVEVAVRAALAS
jgi:hypothetical protein